MRRAPPAHKAIDNPPGQSRTPVRLPTPLLFGHDRRLPRRLKAEADPKTMQGNDPRSGSDGQA